MSVYSTVKSIVKAPVSFYKQIKLTNKLCSEVLYANYFHDCIKNSNWLLNQTFRPSKGAANYSFLFLLFNVLENSNVKNILELGLGQSSKVTTQYVKNKCPEAKLTIIDNNKNWIDTFAPTLDKSSNIKIELRDIEKLPDKSLRYKAENFVQKNEKFDLVIIDGPLGMSQKTPRSNILDLIPDNLSDNFIIILDDYERAGEKHTAKLIFKKLKALNINFNTSVTSGMKRQLLITSGECGYLHWI